MCTVHSTRMAKQLIGYEPSDVIDPGFLWKLFGFPANGFRQESGTMLHRRFVGNIRDWEGVGPLALFLITREKHPLHG